MTSREGPTVESVDLLSDGVVSRGVLLDVARTRGVTWVERWEFLLTIAPLRLRSVTGSPVNPIALF